MQDSAHILQDQVQQAITEQQPLSIRGGNSKAFYGFAVQGDVLEHLRLISGVIEYEPTELVLRARAGTPLSEIEALLEQHQQMLACEPPYFSPTATLGGAGGSRAVWSLQALSGQAFRTLCLAAPFSMARRRSFALAAR